MRFTITQKELKEKVDIVKNAVPARTTMPVLECIYINAEDSLHFVASNLDFEIKTIADGTIDKKGCTAINSKLLSSLISKLNGDEVVFETKGNECVITCGKQKYTLPAVEAGKYPLNNSSGYADEVEITSEQINDTAYAVDVNEHNPVLTALYINTNGTMVGLNQCRIAINSFAGNGKKEFLIPAKYITKIASLSDTTKISFNDKFAKVMSDKYIAYIRLLDGKFFDYKKISEDFDGITVSINRKEYIQSLSALSVFMADKNPVIHNFNNTLKMNISTSLGKGEEVLEIEKNGDDIEIAFNPQLLIDALNHIQDDYVTIKLKDCKSPVLIIGDTYKHLILPVSYK